MPNIYKRLQVELPDDTNLVFKDGTHVMTGDLNLNNNKIINITDPVSATDCATKLYVDTQVTTLPIITVHANRTDLLSDDHTQYLVISGTRSLSDNLDVGNYKVQNVAIPTLSTDVAQKDYADNKVETDLSSLKTSMEWKNSVLDKDLTTSPIASIGNRYILAGTGGSWSTGLVNDITEYTVSGWTFSTPTEGSILWVDDENIVYVYDGSNWIRLGSVTTHSNLNELTVDDHPHYLLVNGSRNISSHLTVNNITATNGIGNSITTISGVNLIAGNLTVPGSSVFNNVSTTSLSAATVTSTTVSGTNITASNTVSGLNYYLNSDLELLNSNLTAATVNSGYSIILKSADTKKWRLVVDNAGTLSTKLIKTITNLTPGITINSITKNPEARYKGEDATVSSWPAWIYGNALPTYSVGSDPTMNQTTPLNGSADKAVLFNSGKYYRYTDNLYLDITTQDIYIEALIESGNATTLFHYLSKYSTNGWYFYWSNATLKFVLTLDDADSAANAVLSNACSQNTWYFVQACCNRDEGSLNGSVIYVNGSGGTGANLANESASLTSATPALIGFSSYKKIAYIGIWFQDNWFSAGATGKSEMDALAAQRWALVNWTV